jgi:hypothetical protein
LFCKRLGRVGSAFAVAAASLRSFCATAAALPARLPTNCPASSLSLLARQFVLSVPESKSKAKAKSKAKSKAADRSVRSTRARSSRCSFLGHCGGAPRPACPRTVRLRRFSPCRTVRPDQVPVSKAKAKSKAKSKSKAKEFCDVPLSISVHWRGTGQKESGNRNTRRTYRRV